MGTRIVVAFDGSRDAREAVSRAIRMPAHGEETEVVLVCSHNRPPDFGRHPVTGALLPPGAWPAEWAAAVTDAMQHEALRVRLAGLEASALCSAADTEDLLLAVARELQAKAIVITDDRRGFWNDRLFGSATRRLLRASEIPVVVVPREDQQER
jgi:nucleotide-binding universal stress UspA family protein